MQVSKFSTGQMTRRASCKCLLLIAAVLLLISGCAAQGAKRVPRDRFDYNAAIAQSTREQMLLNIVRSRYLEVPVFLTVSSVLTQYEYDSSIGLGGILESGAGTNDIYTGDTKMIEFMARGVEVPLEHLEDGWVIDYGLQNSEGEVAKELIPFRMRSSKNRPDNVFAAVRYKDSWYFIDHADITSKRALSLIIVLFRLQAPTPAGAAPILTLPKG